jgi:hypothetical protein
MFLFFFLVLALTSYQTAVVPNQNADVEAQHYTDVQGDLESVRSALINAGESGEKRAAVVSLGTTYPGRIVALNSAPPSGSFSTTEVGDGQYESTDVDLEKVCGLATADSVDTKALDYSRGYDYFDGRNFDHRIESTFLYQATDSEPLPRVNQTIVGERTVTLYPVQGDVSEQGIPATTVEFTGNATGGERMSPDFTITLPSRVEASVWDDRIDHSDVTVSNGGLDEVDLRFEESDDWTVLCKPVGVNQDLQGQVQPSSPPSGEDGAEDDGAGGGVGTSDDSKSVRPCASGPNSVSHVRISNGISNKTAFVKRSSTGEGCAVVSSTEDEFASGTKSQSLSTRATPAGKYRLSEYVLP